MDRYCRIRFSAFFRFRKTYPFFAPSTPGRNRNTEQALPRSPGFLLLTALPVFFFLLMTMPAAGAGVLRVGMQLEPPGLDPTSGAAAAVDEIVYANVFQGLTRILEDGTVAPALATEWTVSGDGLVYEFSLRDGVLFHDGTRFDADDVVFSLDRARSAESSNAQRQLASLITDVTALSALRVRITLSEPVADLPVYLGWGDFVMVAPESAAGNAVHPVGTGPFRFHSWQRGASITLVRNAYDPETPLLPDRIDFVFISDPAAAMAALLAGDIDGFPNVPSPESLGMIEHDGRFRILTGTGEGEIILAINNAIAPFDDLRVRRALQHAVDRQAVIDGALSGYGTPIGSHFPPHHPSYRDLSGRYPYSPERAAALLAEAGYKDGFPVTLTLPPPGYARRGGEIIAAMLEEAGLDVTVRNIEWVQWLEQVFTNREYELTIVAHTEPADIDIYARKDYYFQYRNQEFSDIIDRLRRTGDPEKRDTLYKAAQTLLAEDAVNVFIAQGPKIAVWRKGISGLWSNAPVQANDFTRVRMPAGTGTTALTRMPGSRTGFVLPFTLMAVFAGGAAFLALKSGIGYFLSRLAAAAITLLAASVIVFIMIDIAPGDPAVFIMGLNADPAALEALRTEFGLDRPLLSRFANWTGGMLHGDFGISHTYREPVSTLIAERLRVSFPLALTAFVLAGAAGIPAGLFAAARNGKITGQLVTTISQAGIAMPGFWTAILLVMIFAISLQWFPAGGFPGPDAGFAAVCRALFLPALALAIPQACIITRIMHSATTEALCQDYIRTALAKGLTRTQVILNHALRNALIPVITVMGLQFSFLIAGTVIIENVFYLPGLGRLIFQSITQRDLITVKGIVMILVLWIVTVSFLVDIACRMTDPRLRNGMYGERS